jgi:hypothetical protein
VCIRTEELPRWEKESSYMSNSRKMCLYSIYIRVIFVFSESSMCSLFRNHFRHRRMGMGWYGESMGEGVLTLAPRAVVRQRENLSLPWCTQAELPNEGQLPLLPGDKNGSNFCL